MSDALKVYQSKRNFAITSEPAEGGTPSPGARAFVIQKHWASRLHYDLRLELDGTMKSWAVPKGPSYDNHDKRMAVQVEDHPIAYNSFEGTIPDDQYGAGKVIIWDKGTWEPDGDPAAGYAAGNLKFVMHGAKMQGRWVLVRMKGKGEKQPPWLLIKEKDEFVRPAAEFSVVDAMPDSVKTLAAPKVAKARPARTKKAPVAAESVAKPVAKSVAKSVAKPATKPAAESVAKPAAKPRTSTRSKAPAPDQALTAAMPPGAVPARLPATFAPELATLVDAPPANPSEWVFELKFDGYRMLARVEQGEVKLITRNAKDLTAKLGPLHDALVAMALPDGWYDGEIVVHDAHGKPDFGLLQLAFDGANTANIVYFVFDVPYCGGYDLRAVPLTTRRALLGRILEQAGIDRDRDHDREHDRDHDQVRFSAEFGTDPAELVAAACKIGLEGVIGKKRDSTYVSRRSPEWIKLKCGQRQEFVIAGFTDPQGARQGIGALLLGTYDADGVLQYAGNVGSGFNHASLHDIKDKLTPLETDVSPFPPRTVAGRKHHWVQPTLVAEVSFSEWTSAGAVRHPVFQGLRLDKPARAVTRDVARHLPARAVPLTSTEETAMERPAKKTRAAPAHAAKAADADKAAKAANAANAPAGAPAPEASLLPAGLKITHGERVIDAHSGATKADLVRYYALVGALMLPHLKSRPVSLVRAPAGVGGQLFFQKHAEVDKLPGVKQLAAKLDPAHPPMLEVAGVDGLLAAAQWNVIEFHTQNALARAYEKPNRMVFDLDPGEGVDWSMIQEAAQLIHAFLDQLGLAAFLKTSGGKGLHVVVPIKGTLGWDAVKDFSQAVVQHMAQTLPERFSVKSGAKNRVGKIFIDYLRNGRGATTACAWSARTRPGLGISVPVRWEELAGLNSGDQWTIQNVHTRLDQGNAPWDAYDSSARTLTAAMKTLGFKPA